MTEPIFRLSVVPWPHSDGTRDFHAQISPDSVGLQGVFVDWGSFPSSLAELRSDALKPSSKDFEWAGDTVVIKFDEPEVLKLYDNFALMDGLEPEPTLITRKNFIDLIDQWMKATAHP